MLNQMLLLKDSMLTNWFWPILPLIKLKKEEEELSEHMVESDLILIVLAISNYLPPKQLHMSKRNKTKIRSLKLKATKLKLVNNESFI